ncbi:hypothetical protein BJY01DRAFT_41052 [Aspergillus pseudoustus]|uniref:Uncharacterized protein n=1 Tax=Aspergillus pseudoustus TaxID=1810923 RepID=A0ABR4JCL4_9EURO
MISPPASMSTRAQSVPRSMPSSSLYIRGPSIAPVIQYGGQTGVGPHFGSTPAGGSASLAGDPATTAKRRHPVHVSCAKLVHINIQTTKPLGTALTSTALPGNTNSYAGDSRTLVASTADKSMRAAAFISSAPSIQFAGSPSAMHPVAGDISSTSTDPNKEHITSSPGSSSKCLLMAADHMAQYARDIDNYSKARTQREAQLENERATLKETVRQLGLAMRKAEIERQQLREQMEELQAAGNAKLMATAKEVKDLKEVVQRVPEMHELLKGFDTLLEIVARMRSAPRDADST